MIPDFMNPVKFLVRSSFKWYKKSTVTCLQYKVLTQISNNIWGVENISMVQILGNVLKPQIFASKLYKDRCWNFKCSFFSCIFHWGFIHKLILLVFTKYGLILLKWKMTLTSAVLRTPYQVQFCLKS